MFGEKEAQNLCRQILKKCGQDQAEVLLFVEDNALTRFANNSIHQNVAEYNAELLVRLVLDKRIGMASTNRTDAAALDEVVEKARFNAKGSAEDPEYPGLAEPTAYIRVEAFDSPTAAYPAVKRAEVVSVVCRLAAEKELNASGAFSTGYGEVVVANSQGVFAYHAATSTDFQTVVMAPDSSGRAQASGWRVEEISAEAIGREAIIKAERGRAPQKIEPGEYTVILDPYATQDILNMLNFYGIGAQAVLEGRSWMNNRQGQKAMSALVSIWDDGLDPNGQPIPFDFEGVPKQHVDIVKAGVVGNPVYDRYTARKAGVASTGHALPPNMRSMGPVATNMFMAPGSATLEEMIHSTERGLYITRFWYTRLVHPLDCVITGMTRDGVIMVEHGELTHPVKNLRFTQSYVQALADVEAVGRETRLLIGDFGSFADRVPALKIARFNFTGSTV